MQIYLFFVLLPFYSYLFSVFNAFTIEISRFNNIIHTYRRDITIFVIVMKKNFFLMQIFLMQNILSENLQKSHHL